ncbi:MAG: DUF465 domain-containing protein [Deltaproteobacteria bacterium]
MAQSTHDIAGLIAELRREHEELDAKVSQLVRRPHLGVAEEAEVRRLKKLKLARKDRMFALAREKSPARI